MAEDDTFDKVSTDNEKAQGVQTNFKECCTMLIRTFTKAVLFLLLFTAAACAPTKITLFPDATEPFQQILLSGKDTEKILVIPVAGVITDVSEDKLLTNEPGMVQEIVAQLRKAETDPEIRAVLLQINTPGGGVTASDILYHELRAYSERAGVPVFALMMDLATSGGYYVALAAERIMAHPTTVTGSVGVIFLRPNVTELFDMIGVRMFVTKSGRFKDSGSPFRMPTTEEDEIFSGIIEASAARFLDLVRERRNVTEEDMASISTARVFPAEDARRLGLVDEIGYVQDALNMVGRSAGLGADPRVVIFRRQIYSDDTIYNTQQARQEGEGFSFSVLPRPVRLSAGVYAIWPGALEGGGM